MNKRVAKITLGINSLRISEIYQCTQADTNTHFINATFLDDVELNGWELLVLYKPPFPAQNSLVDLYSQPQQTMNIKIPNACLNKSGRLVIEFALRKSDTKELITVNRSLTLEIIKTINATMINAGAVGELENTISKQIEKIEELVKDFNESYDEIVVNLENTVEKKINEIVAPDLENLEKRVDTVEDTLETTVDDSDIMSEYDAINIINKYK